MTFTMKRDTFLLANVLFSLPGLALIAYGLYVKFGDDFYNCTLGNGNAWDVDIFLMVGGGFIVSTAISRCICLLRPRKRVIAVAIVATVLIFIFGLVVMIMVFGFYYQPKEYAVEAATKAIKERYGESGEGKDKNKISKATDAIDDIQKKYKCCGINGYTDWQGSKWSSKTGLRVPRSCCNTGDYTTCQSKSANASTIFAQNCSKELEDWAGKIIPLIGGLGCAMFILAIVGGALTYITMRITCSNVI